MTKRPGRHAFAATAVASVLVAGCVGGSEPEARTSAPGAGAPAAPAGKAFRAFSADSWWNTPVPRDAPKSPIARQILAYMRTAPDNSGGCLRLAGTGENKWGQPVFWAKPGDPVFNVRVGGGDSDRTPPELRNLRIPLNAEAAATSDAAMTIFDRSRGIVTALTGARYEAASDTWFARGATVTYLDSNGLHWRTGRSDERRNFGSHRGNNGAVMMVRYDEVAAGAVRHVVKVASGPELRTGYVFPMIGSDGDSNNPVAPPQGLRFRIKPSVDIDAMRLGRQATVIAKALQRYGMYLGDSAGTTTLKLEDTRATGQGQLWRLSSTALCKLPFTPKYWDVIRGGYDPSR